MPDNALELLARGLREERPLVLLAGQSFGISGSEGHSVIDLFHKRLGSQTDQPDWKSVFLRTLTDADMAWLTERFDRTVPSVSTLRVIDLPWSAVFTSSIDPRFSNRFETRGRQPETVLAAGQYARVSRSRSRPPIHYLFGTSNETFPETRSPRTRVELAVRTQTQANELLFRIAETTTARGILIISGLVPGRDWLDTDSLFAGLLTRPGLKVIWFDAPNEPQSELEKEMLATGALLKSNISLTTAVTTLEASGLIDLDSTSSPDEPGLITTSAGPIDITAALRLRVEASATIIDDSWTTNHDSPTDDAISTEFRNFHGDLRGFRTLLEGIGRGFAIERSFEKILYDEVQRALKQTGFSDGLVLLHGQSATGKSVAIARLARALRETLRAPVLVTISRIPAAADIDAFCSEVENLNAGPTVLLCDANSSIHRYRELISSLQSRGRRLILVGTCYRIEERFQKGLRQLIEAPSVLTDDELAALNNLLRQFAPEVLSSPRPTEGWNVLAWLYRHLSAGRSRISSGISRESRHAERTIRERVTAVPRKQTRSALADQLFAAGLVSESFQLFVDDGALSTVSDDAAGQLIDLVMVAGRLNIPVPVNLVLRVLSSRSDQLDFIGIAYIFEDLDLFRWRAADAEGAHLLISPRIQLEAELICQRRLADPDREIEYLVALIKGARVQGVDGSTERVFVLDLLQKLDREGPRANAYRRGYLRFADALQDLREKRGVRDASLMLRECVFRRQAIFSLDGSDDIDGMNEEERIITLDKAREVIEEALRLVETGDLRAGRRNRLNMSVERASIYGYLAVQRTRSGDAAMWSDYEAARVASLRALALTDDYHPFDITLWTACDVLSSNNISASERVELLSDIYSTLDLAATMDFRQEQRNRYDERRAKVAEVVKDNQLADDAIASLEKTAPAAAAFLKARRRSDIILIAGAPLSPELRSQAGEIAADLEACSASLNDIRCLRLILKLRWAQSTGEHLFGAPRGRTPSEQQDVSRLLVVVRNINEYLGEAARNQDRFLEAVLTWLAGDHRGASELWKRLSHDTEFEDRSRVIRRLLSTDSKGLPIRYRGRIHTQKRLDRWQVVISGFSTPIGLLEHEFRDEQVAPGRQLNDFGIAFNYIGPIADALLQRDLPA